MYKIIGIAAGLSLFAVAGMASAASIPSYYDALFDGQTEAWGNPNEVIDLEALVSVDSGEVLHAVSTDVIGDGIPRECQDISNVQGEQERNVSFDHKLPPNTGDYGFEIRGYTADNMSEANAHKGNTACVGDYDSLYSESDVIHVIPDGGSSGPDEDLSGDSMPSWLVALFAALGIDINNPAPAKPAWCSSLESYAMLYVGSTGPQVSALQGILMANGFNIPALTQGAAYGYYGSQTFSAHSSAKAQCM